MIYSKYSVQFVRKLGLLLKLTGFSKWELYGDFDKSPYSYESKEMIWIIKK